MLVIEVVADRPPQFGQVDTRFVGVPFGQPAKLSQDPTTIEPIGLLEAIRRSAPERGRGDASAREVID